MDLSSRNLSCKTRQHPGRYTSWRTTRRGRTSSWTTGCFVRRFYRASLCGVRVVENGRALATSFKPPLMRPPDWPAVDVTSRLLVRLNRRALLTSDRREAFNYFATVSYMYKYVVVFVRSFYLFIFFLSFFSQMFILF